MSMLSQKAINDFKKIWKEEFKEDLSDEKANAEGTKLLNLIKLISRPIQKRKPQSSTIENKGQYD